MRLRVTASRIIEPALAALGSRAALHASTSRTRASGVMFDAVFPEEQRFIGDSKDTASAADGGERR